MVEPGANLTFDNCFNDPSLNPAKKKALFNFNVNHALRDVTDGTSNTVALSEVISGPDGGPDPRGSWATDEWGSQYTHHRTPNSAIPDAVLSSVPWRCNPQKAPCAPTAPCWSTIDYAARSFHPGGVNVVMVDGSVHFISNGIDLQTWQDWRASMVAKNRGAINKPINRGDEKQE